MILTKLPPQTELQKVKDELKNQGFDYDKISLRGFYTSTGDIISIETDNPKLISILRAKGFS